MNPIPSVSLFASCAITSLLALSAIPIRAQELRPGADATADLKSLAEKPGMLLATGPGRAPEHFGFACRYQGGEGDKLWAWDLWAVRDGKRVITLVRSGRGEGKMYTRAVACDGVVVCLDPKQPGGIVAADGVWPSVQVRSEDGEFKFNFGGSSKEPDLLFDPASVIKDALAKARDVKVSPDGRAMIARTDRGALAVTPTRGGTTVPSPLAQLEIPGAGMRFVVAVFDRRSAEKIAGIRPLTLDVVKGLGLPTRTPSPPELLRLLIPAEDDVATDRRHLAASAKLSDLPRDPDYHFPADADGAQLKR